MRRWLIRPDGGVGWAVLLVAVFNFAPSQFSSSYVGEANAWVRVVKDVPIVLLVIALLGHSLGRNRAEGLLPTGSRINVGVLRGGNSNVGDVMTAFAMAIALLALFMLISAVWTGTNASGTLVSARYYVLYPALALLLVVSGPFQPRQLAVGVVLLGVLQTGLAVADYAGAFGATFYSGLVHVAGFVFPRAIGTLGNPNNLGLFLGFATLIVFATPGRHTSWGKILLVVLSFGIVLTGSKTALIAVALAWSGLFLRDRRQPWSWRWALLFAGMLAACATVVVLMAAHRLGAEPTLTGALGTHGQSAETAIGQWLESPETALIGRGFDVQASVGADGRVHEYPIDTMPLALAVEGGVVALLMFGFVLTLGVRLILLCPHSSSLGAIARGFALMMFAYAAVAVSFRLFPGALIFWLLVGLCGSAASEMAREGDSTRTSSSTGGAEASTPDDAIKTPLTRGSGATRS